MQRDIWDKHVPIRENVLDPITKLLIWFLHRFFVLVTQNPFPGTSRCPRIHKDPCIAWRTSHQQRTRSKPKNLPQDLEESKSRHGSSIVDGSLCSWQMVWMEKNWDDMSIHFQPKRLEYLRNTYTHWGLGGSSMSPPSPALRSKLSLGSNGAIVENMSQCLFAGITQKFACIQLPYKHFPNFHQHANELPRCFFWAHHTFIPSSPERSVGILAETIMQTMKCIFFIGCITCAMVVNMFSRTLQDFFCTNHCTCVPLSIWRNTFVIWPWPLKASRQSRSWIDLFLNWILVRAQWTMDPDLTRCAHASFPITFWCMISIYAGYDVHAVDPYTRVYHLIIIPKPSKGRTRFECSLGIVWARKSAMCNLRFGFFTPPQKG